MPIVALLALALICLVLGLVLASGPWLLGSLAASAVAAYLLWHQRNRLTDRPRAGDDPGLAARRADARERADKIAGKDDVWVVDGQPFFHGEFCPQIEGQGAEPVPVTQAVGDGFTSCPSCKPAGPRRDRRVWVVDGVPDYHEASCATIADLQAEAVWLSQATEDGFAACTVCDAARGGDPTEPAETRRRPRPGAGPTPASRTVAGPVWVVDGRPRFHAAGCLIIKDQDAEAIPLAQATEDGFIPCTLCRPSVGAAQPQV